MLGHRLLRRDHVACDQVLADRVVFLVGEVHAHAIGEIQPADDVDALVDPLQVVGQHHVPLLGRERLAATREQVEASQRLARHYENEYKSGRRSLLDLLDAENAVFSSQFQLASVTAVQVFSAYQLLATMGRLLATLGIAAPPEARAGLLDQTDRGPFGIDLEIEPLRKP